MNVKGFILEDDQGRELVMGCERPHDKLGRMFMLRGWQRRRLVPLQYSEPEKRHIVSEVLLALDDLFNHIRVMARRRSGHRSSSGASPKPQALAFERTPKEKVQSTA